MFHTDYSYAATLAAAERVHWRIEDLIGDDARLDFTRPFLPEALARVGELSFLSAAEQRTVNQIRSHTYLCLFGLVEEFILPFVLDHARPDLYSDDHRVRALLQFAADEAKHIHMFRRFRKVFEADFPVTCPIIGPAEDIAATVLSHHPLAVALVVLHIEWMTQRHYLDSVRDDQSLEPMFKNLLKHHWLEEAQHAKLDMLMVATLAANCGDDEIDGAIDEYLEIGGFLDGGLEQQVQFEMDSFQRATGRTLSADERSRYMASQRQATRWTYLGSGMTHDKVRETLDQLSIAGSRRVADVAPIFC